MRKLKISDNHVVKLDNDDFDAAQQYRWQYSNGYALRTLPDGELSFMHRDLVCVATDEYVEHVDGDWLNNQRHNLVVKKKR